MKMSTYMFPFLVSLLQPSYVKHQHNGTSVEATKMIDLYIVVLSEYDRSNVL